MGHPVCLTVVGKIMIDIYLKKSISIFMITASLFKIYFTFIKYKFFRNEIQIFKILLEQLPASNWLQVSWRMKMINRIKLKPSQPFSQCWIHQTIQGKPIKVFNIFLYEKLNRFLWLRSKTESKNFVWESD